MFDVFDFDPLEVGNPMTLGMMDEQNVDNAKSAYNYLRQTFGTYMRKEDIDNALDRYDVDYFALPQYAKDWFDDFEI